MHRTRTSIYWWLLRIFLFLGCFVLGMSLSWWVSDFWNDLVYPFPNG